MNSKVLLVLALCTVVSQKIFSQLAPQWDWATKTQTTFTTQLAVDVHADKLGSVFILGRNRSYTWKDTSTFLSKYTNGGTLVWTRLLAYTPVEIGTDDLGNVYVLGSNNPNTWFDLYLEKFNSSGVSVWLKSYSNHIELEGRGLTVDGSGNVYITGSFKSAIAFPPFNLTASTTWPTLFVTKVNTAGTTLWATTEQKNGWGRDICLDHFNNVYVAGYYVSDTTCDYLCGQAFVLKYSPQGTVLLKKDTVTGDFMDMNGIAVDQDENIFLIGSGTWKEFEPTLYKYNKNMKPIWSSDLGGNNSRYTLYNGFSLDQHGDAFVAGQMGYILNFLPEAQPGDTIVIGNQPLISYGDADFIVTKINGSSGSYAWTKTAGGPARDGWNWSITNGRMCMDQSGNGYLTGDFNTAENGTANVYFDNHTIAPDGPWEQMFLAKLKLSNNNVAVNETGAVPLPRIYPNPSSGRLTISGYKVAGDLNVRVFDATGHCVHCQQGSGAMQVDLEHMTPGIYFVEANIENRISRQKIIIE